VCQERWDIFSLWKKFQAQDDLRFTQVLFGLERAFGILTPEAPEMSREVKSRGPTEEEQEVLQLLEVCERRLRQAKPFCEMVSFLRMSQVLDALHYKVSTRDLAPATAKGVSKALLDKIGEKIRSA